MRFTELSVAGLFLIEAEPFSDNRGFFRRHFCREEYVRHGLDPSVMQGNISENPKRGTLRGFHYQRSPAKEGKTLSCLCGSVYNITVDLRPISSTFLKWEAVTLSASMRNSLYVPAGCGNAWLTLEDQTFVHYYMTALYDPRLDAGLRYNDPAFDFIWPFEPLIISEKDVSYPDFDSKRIRG